MTTKVTKIKFLRNVEKKTMLYLQVHSYQDSTNSVTSFYQSEILRSIHIVQKRMQQRIFFLDLSSIQCEQCFVINYNHYHSDKCFLYVSVERK